MLNQGVCTIGRFNHIFGLPAFKDGRLSGRYEVDFCANPTAVCSNFTVPVNGNYESPTSVDTSEVRYLLGMLYWVDFVQTYSWGYWDYIKQLKLFVGKIKVRNMICSFASCYL